MRNAGLEEAQAGIKIAGRNLNNLRYADDTTLMAESEEELKSLLMKVKERQESRKDNMKTDRQMMAVYMPRREAEESSSLTVSEGTNFADTLSSDFWPQEL